MQDNICKKGFTLAEVLITLGVVGVVSAITLPTLIQNVQERVRKEQVRSVKYKLTQATDAMKSHELITAYPTTQDFVNELQKYYKIAKVCDNSNLESCWPTKTIKTPDGDINISSIKTGENLKALGIGTKNTTTVGIVTADGTPMIMTYSPQCTPLDSAKTYTWSTVDDKPETNATTNCISAIFDINGKTGPNRIGTDVRTLNSIFGYKILPQTYLTKSECEKYKNSLGIKACYYDKDYWAGAVKVCADLKMHLPSIQTLANMAGVQFGRTDIGSYTIIDTVNDCPNYYIKRNYHNRVEKSDAIICIKDKTNLNDANSPISFNELFWAYDNDQSGKISYVRGTFESASAWLEWERNNSTGSGSLQIFPLCVGD